MQLPLCAVLMIFGAIVASGVENPDSSSTGSPLINTTSESISEREVLQIPVGSNKNGSDIYGESDDEQLGELSVIDILFRKRRSESDYDVDDKTTEKTDYSPVIYEEMEFSYEEIIDGSENSTYNNNTSNEQENNGKVKPDSEFDHLVPPAPNAKQIYLS